MDNYEYFATDDMLLKKVGNIYIFQKQIDILKKYDIQVEKYKSIKELIFTIEEMLNNSNDELNDLEWVSSMLSEYNYYQNTNK